MASKSNIRSVDVLQPNVTQVKARAPVIDRHTVRQKELTQQNKNFVAFRSDI